MVRSRLRLKALALCAFALGLMAFAASAAQAETGAKWGILKANNELVTINPESEGGIGDKLLPTVGAEVDVTPTLRTEVSKKSILIPCTGVSLADFKLELLGKLSEGKATFTGCTFLGGEILLATCKPHSKGDPEGTIVTKTLYGLAKLHSGTSTVLILPVTGDLIADIVLGKDPPDNECAFGEKLPLSGKLSVKDNNNLFATHEVKHLITEFAALTDMWVLNKTTEHKATASGSLWAFLTGEHLNLKWAGLV